MYTQEYKIVKGKNPDRVRESYRKWPDDWNRQYNMLLMDGKTCEDCLHANRCCSLFGQQETDTSCQFWPNKFTQK